MIALLKKVGNGVYNMGKISKIIRGLREDHDLSQKEIAKIIGTTQQHYSKYENNECEIPLRVIVLLADYYKVSLDYLTGRTKCKSGIDKINKNFINDCTNGELIDKITKLKRVNKLKLQEYILFLESIN